MNFLELYEYGKKKLAEAGIDSPEVDTTYLIQKVFNISRGQLLIDPYTEADPDEAIEFLELIQKRSERYPCQYLMGDTEFMGLTFKVNESVLIPRQDTETLVEKALRIIPDGAKVLDLCTGSGCIGISVKAMLHGLDMTLADISKDALKVAAENAENQGIDVKLVCSDLFENINEKFDVILSNPPYVTEGEYEELMPEVRDYEPKLALVAGEDGLDMYRRIAKEAPEHLTEKGILMVEIGCDQADAVKSLFEQNGFENVKVTMDLAGHNRVVTGQLAK